MRQGGDKVQSQREYVLRQVEERGVRFVQLWFTDVLGTPKTVSITPAELENALDEGMTFDGSAIDGFSRRAGVRRHRPAGPDDLPDPALPRRRVDVGTCVLRRAQHRRDSLRGRSPARAPAGGRAGVQPGLQLLRLARARVLLFRRRRPRRQLPQLRLSAGGGRPGSTGHERGRDRRPGGGARRSRSRGHRSRRRRSHDQPRSGLPRNPAADRPRLVLRADRGRPRHGSAQEDGAHPRGHGHPGRVRPARGRPRPARDRPSLHRRPDDGRHGDDRAPRRQGDRARARCACHVHAEAPRRRAGLGDAHSLLAVLRGSQRLLRRRRRARAVEGRTPLHRRAARACVRDHQRSPTSG